MEQINNFKVVPVKVKDKNVPNLKGKELFEIYCPNIFNLASKAKGKTTVNYNIILNCGGKHTKYIFIVDTIEKDPIWKMLTKKLGDRCACFTDIIDEDGNDVIEQFRKTSKSSEESDDEETEQTNDFDEPEADCVMNRRLFTYVSPMIEKKEKKEKKDWNYPYPEYIIVLDDLGDSMRAKSVANLIRRNRHYNAMVIASSQDLNDLLPAARRNLDYALVFSGLDDDKLVELFNILKLDIDFDQFHRFYIEATKEPHSFLYINRRKDEYRCCFDKRFKKNVLV